MNDKDAKQRALIAQLEETIDELRRKLNSVEQSRGNTDRGRNYLDSAEMEKVELEVALR